MAEQILGRFKNKVAGVTLIPGSGGVFLVTKDGQQIFSKKETGRFPEWAEIEAQL